MPATPRVFTLPVDDLVAPATLGAPPNAEALARALAASPPWANLPEAVMVVRPEPRPLVGLLGTFEEEGVRRVEALRWQLHDALGRLRYVDYAQAERDCAVLAEKLADRFGELQLRTFDYVGIPRGGLLVLGMLAYALDLDRDRVHTALAAKADGPLVVVDDCSLTGARFGQFAERFPDREIIFAPLYSHPDLRAALTASDARYTACLSARDLHDHAPDRMGDDYEAWRARWMERSDARCRWVGLPDHVCFPWSEPDIAIWNPVTEREELGWRIVPPSACLKNRARAGKAPERLQVQTEPEGAFRLPETLLYGTLDDGVVIADTDAGTAFRLEGVAAAMWHALLDHPTHEDALSTLQSTYRVNRATLHNDLKDFTQRLQQHGLLLPPVTA